MNHTKFSRLGKPDIYQAIWDRNNLRSFYGTQKVKKYSEKMDPLVQNWTRNWAVGSLVYPLDTKHRTNPPLDLPRFVTSKAVHHYYLLNESKLNIHENLHYLSAVKSCIDILASQIHDESISSAKRNHRINCSRRSKIRNWLFAISKKNLDQTFSPENGIISLAVGKHIVHDEHFDWKCLFLTIRSISLCLISPKDQMLQRSWNHLQLLTYRSLLVPRMVSTLI